VILVCDYCLTVGRNCEAGKKRKKERKQEYPSLVHNAIVVIHIADLVYDQAR